MAVAVHDRLAGCIADIIPDIIPVRFEIILNDSFAFVNEIYHCQLFFVVEGKIIRYVPEGDYQKMPLGDREPIPAGITQRVSGNDVITER